MSSVWSPPAAAALDGVAADAIALEHREDVAQRLVGDLADGARGQRQLVALALRGSPASSSLLGHLLEPLQILGRLGAQQLLDALGIDVLEIFQGAHAADLALELVELLHLLHETHRLLQRDLLVALEGIALGHLVERQELAQVHGQLAHLRLPAARPGA